MTLTGDVHHHIPQSNRSAAVTGAGSGLGRDIALGLAARNYRVFGTAFSTDEVADLRQASNGAVDLTVCDITSEASIKNWIRHVETLAEGLDLLINNAGVLTPGPLEVLPLAAVRREFDVNVFGALAVINGFLPALRRNRGRNRPNQHLDGQPAASVQRAVGRIESRNGGIRDRLPRGA